MVFDTAPGDRRFQLSGGEPQPRCRPVALMVDVDGVLIDGRPTDGRHWQATLETDLGISPALLQERFFAPVWEEVVRGRVDLVDALTPVLRAIAPHVSVDAFLAYWFAHDARVNLPLLEALARLRAEGVAVHLVTNQEHRRADHLMRTLDLASHVDGIFYSAQLGTRKPEPRFFETVVTRVSIAPESLLLVDDTLANVDTARRVGWHAFHWRGRDALTDLLRLIA